MMTAAAPRRVPPEVDLAALFFAFHFGWEILQAPLFSSLDGMSHARATLVCLQATQGDVAIAFGAFWLAAWAGPGRGWTGAARGRDVAVFLGAGLVATVVLEYVHTEITARWTYGAAMPRLPGLGTGLAPLAQWVVVPLIVLWFMRRLSPAPAPGAATTDGDQR